MRRHPKASYRGSTKGIADAAAAVGARLSLGMAAALVLLLALAPAALAAGGRAYELVSPADKGGAEVGDTPSSGSYLMPAASADGKRVFFLAPDAYPGSEANLLVDSYLAERGSAEWKTDFLSSATEPVFNIATASYNGLADDLSYGVILWSLEPKLTADAPDGTPILYRRDFASGEYVDLTPGAEANNLAMSTEFAGASKDFGHIVMAITNGGELTPETPVGSYPLLYDWSEASGELTLVGHLPNNTVPAVGAEIARPPGTSGSAIAPFNAVSADGSRIFYLQRVAGINQLYARIDGTTTKWLSQSHRTPVDPNGPKEGFFQFASEDGSVAFLSSAEKLTDDATTGPNDEGSDLYRYEVNSETLTDITVDGAEEAGARLQGVIGGAENGSNLYFVAKGVLAAGATAGQNNLYEWTDDGSAKGSIRFIVTGLEPSNWSDLPVPFESRLPTRVTPDGKHLLFESTASLTGYPNAGRWEAYLFDSETAGIVCASCNPSGTPATADALAVGTGDFALRAHTLSDDGSHVFFTTAEQLAGGDNNTVDDTYEYDATSGQVNLISSGKAEIPSPFTDASSNGSDVFFTTRQQLVGIDTDDNVDVYDARVGGGIAAQNPSPAPEPCSGLACRGEVTAPLPASTPASATLNGPGNKKHHRKHQKKHHRKHQKKHHRKHQGKQGGKHRSTARNANRHGNR